MRCPLCDPNAQQSALVLKIEAISGAEAPLIPAVAAEPTRQRDPRASAAWRQPAELCPGKTLLNTLAIVMFVKKK